MIEFFGNSGHSSLGFLSLNMSVTASRVPLGLGTAGPPLIAWNINWQCFQSISSLSTKAVIMHLELYVVSMLFLSLLSTVLLCPCNLEVTFHLSSITLNLSSKVVSKFGIFLCHNTFIDIPELFFEKNVGVLSSAVKWFLIC